MNIVRMIKTDKNGKEYILGRKYERNKGLKLVLESV